MKQSSSVAPPVRYRRRSYGRPVSYLALTHSTVKPLPSTCGGGAHVLDVLPGRVAGDLTKTSRSPEDSCHMLSSCFKRTNRYPSLQMFQV
eukprot:354472-Chlamydomonas_euryale.AAC.1